MIDPQLFTLVEVNVGGNFYLYGDTFKSINWNYDFTFKLDVDENMKMFSWIKPCLKIEMSKI